mmetsp:Transcript_8058/g.17616  ORF Transcript_8058/g.17616 Transcript_8058/m.17616 type:complete len:219 (-) Transcript_8058:427-1083(-)
MVLFYRQVLDCRFRIVHSAQNFRCCHGAVAPFATVHRDTLQILTLYEFHHHSNKLRKHAASTHNVLELWIGPSHLFQIQPSSFPVKNTSVEMPLRALWWGLHDTLAVGVNEQLSASSGHRRRREISEVRVGLGVQGTRNPAVPDESRLISGAGCLHPRDEARTEFCWFGEQEYLNSARNILFRNVICTDLYAVAVVPHSEPLLGMEVQRTRLGEPCSL